MMMDERRKSLEKSPHKANVIATHFLQSYRDRNIFNSTNFLPRDHKFSFSNEPLFGAELKQGGLTRHASKEDSPMFRRRPKLSPLFVRENFQDEDEASLNKS